MGSTSSAFGAQKALFSCSVAHTDVRPCFRFLNLRLQAQFCAGLILSMLLRRCQPVVGMFCRQEESFLRLLNFFFRVTVWLLLVWF